ncbi:MAG: UbiH/UbiF/VisC/COQ6 family ubiquinone biosynthesis hydroxylase [Gammaproteobacteria bacterium]
MHDHDVIIIGGGIVGATLACALGQSGMRVALLEAREPVIKVGSDPRVYAITRASEQIFRSLAVWEAIAVQPVCAFTDMEVWDAAGEGVLHFDCAELAEPWLGHIIEPGIMQAALQDRLKLLAGVDVYCPSVFTQIDVGADQVIVTLEDGHHLSAPLLAAADGARSPVREQLGIGVRRHDYHQTSLAARVQTALPHANTAWQRFLPGGPLAFLPLVDGWSSIVWTLPQDEIERIQALDPVAFHQALGSAFDYKLGKILASGPRQVWPLVRQHAVHYVQARVALLGDAAHAIHPLAGQGVNLGLLDAAVLAGVVLEARAGHRDTGSLHTLRRYERWRRSDNTLMMSAMDGINRLFSNANLPAGRLRSAGLSLVGKSAAVRHALMRHAMGIAGDLPALARPH